eukprot:NODE_82_length_22625_cov_0.476516.p2 type:complete len:819 gc:universal NODE_82_length_22625_cov_0.476516:15101-17557(+)
MMSNIVKDMLLLLIIQILAVLGVGSNLRTGIFQLPSRSRVQELQDPQKKSTGNIEPANEKPANIAFMKEMDDKIEKYTKLKANKGIISKLRLLYNDPLEVQFGLTAADLIATLNDIKDGKLDIDTERIDALAVSREAVDYVLAKLTNLEPSSTSFDDNEKKKKIKERLLSVQEKYKNAEKIRLAMKSIQRSYAITSKEEFERIFNGATIDSLLKSPLSVEYALNKLENVKVGDSEAFKHEVFERLKDKQNQFEKEQPNDVIQARKLIKQREVLKNEMPHDTTFIVLGVFFGAYSFYIHEMAVVVIGSVLASFTFLKMVLNNGHNAKEALIAITQSLDLKKAEDFKHAYYNTINSDVFKEVSQEAYDGKTGDAKDAKLIEDLLSSPVDLNFVKSGDKSLIDERKFNELSNKVINNADESVKDLLRDTAARGKLMAIIQKEGLSKILADSMPDDQRRNIYFVAEATSAMLRLQPMDDKRFEVSDISKDDFVRLSHPQVLDQAQSFLSQRVKELERAAKTATNDQDKSSIASGVDKLKQQKQYLNEAAGLTLKRRFFRVMAPFIKVLAVVLKVSILSYGFGFLVADIAIAKAQAGIAMHAAFDAVVRMSSMFYGGFVLSATAAAIAKVFGPDIISRIKHTLKLGDAPKPAFDADKMAESMLESMRVTDTVDSFSIWRSLSRPKYTLLQFYEMVKNPIKSSKNGWRGLNSGLRSGLEKTKVMAINSKRRAVQIASFNKIKFEKEYTRTDKERKQKIDRIIELQKAAHDATTGLKKDLVANGQQPGVIEQTKFHLSNVPVVGSTLTPPEPDGPPADGPATRPA